MHSYILYAEDDHDDQELLKECMSGVQGVDLVCVNDGLRLLRFLEKLEPEKHYPCLIILDINMPVLDGLQALNILKKDVRYADIPAVIFSTSAGPKDKQIAKELGADDFITKPLTSERMKMIASKFVDFCKPVDSAKE